MQYLFDMGAPDPLDSQSGRDLGVFMLAAATPHQLDVLLAMGADLSTFAKCTYLSPFLFAASQGWTDSCILLLKNGSDANETTLYPVENAAILAARFAVRRSEDFSCLHELISRGVNPSERARLDDVDVTAESIVEEARFDKGFLRVWWEQYVAGRKRALLRGHPCAIPDIADLVAEYV